MPGKTKHTQVQLTFMTAGLLIVLSACNTQKNKADATGTFEATEILISAEASGVLKSFSLTEGTNLKAGQAVGYIDSTQLFLRKRQLEAQIKAVLSKVPDINTQLAALEEQSRQAEREQKRIASLLKADAATQKQMDDINSQLLILQKQINAQRSSLGITSTGLTEESNPLIVQIEQVRDQLQKCRIVNPVNGTVLGKYAEAFEMTNAGKPLYKIADVSTLILRVYVTGDQLTRIKTGQQVKVLVTQDNDTGKEYPGIIEWISDKSEFTPKTIQTKEERANLVYAAKVRVKNDGYLKIGMYADIFLN